MDIIKYQVSIKETKLDFHAFPLLQQVLFADFLVDIDWLTSAFCLCLPTWTDIKPNLKPLPDQFSHCVGERVWICLGITVTAYYKSYSVVIFCSYIEGPPVIILSSLKAGSDSQ